MNAEPLDPELTLKSMPPKTPRTLVVRERLATDSPRLAGRKVVLLQAPAGYGKTALLIQWRKQALQRGAVMVWLTLDEQDAPERFVRGLRTALELSAAPELSARTPDLLHDSGTAATAGLTMWLARVGLLSSEVLVMLDGLHLPPQATIRQCVRYLVLNAPANVNIIMTSQVAVPAASSGAVAEGVVAVLTARDLAFTAEEVAELMHLNLGVRIDASGCRKAYELTGGWPLGAQMLATAARNAEHPADVIDTAHDTLQGFDEYIERFVLAGLPAREMDFLLRVSTVPVLSAELCEALTERDDAAALLQSLSSTTPLFDELVGDGWVRLHSLARDYLRARSEVELPAEVRMELHRKAAHWFAAHDLHEHAARQALAGGMKRWAYDLVEKSLPAVWGRGDLDRAIEWVDTVPREELFRRPALALVAASALAVAPGRNAQRQPLLDRALEHAAKDPVLQRQAAAAMLEAAISHDDGPRVKRLVQEWQEQTGQGCVALDLFVTHARSMECMYRGDVGLARHLWSDLSVDAEHPIAGLAACLRHTTIADTYLWEGHPEPAVLMLRTLQGELESRLGRRSLLATGTAALLATALWDLGEVSQAAEVLADRLDVLENVQMFRPVYMGFAVAARTTAAAGNEARALGILERLATLGQLRRVPRYTIESLAEQIRFHAHAHRATTCRALQEQLDRLCSDPEVQRNQYCADYRLLLLETARTYCLLAAEEFPAALKQAKAAFQRASGLRLRRQALVLLLLQALAGRRSGSADVDAMLQEALSLARTYGLRSMVTDAHPDVTDLLPHGDPYFVASAEPAPAAAAEAVPPRVIETRMLTKRERDVLQCLVDGMPNKRIALGLGLGDETVKWHVKNVLQKLGGANRRHVVDRARQLGIVG